MTDSVNLLKTLQTLHPKIIDLSLGRIERLAKALGHPERNIPPAIHIAGTNGKGSTLAFIEAILNGHGKKIHKFTSPHLVSFHERIVLAEKGFGRSQPITEQALIDILTRTEKANKQEPITFFEITTAAAFLAFAETKADFTLLETGLGGRLDATNIVPDPLTTVISSISMDHMQFLGDKLDLIAREKAGIMKRNVPCVVGRQEPDASIVFENYADAMDAPLIMMGRDWDVHEQHGRLIYQDNDALFDLPLPNLFGRHQIENAGLAIATVQHIPDLNITQEALEYGLQNTFWPARLERLQLGSLHDHLVEDSEIWLDGGHNPDAGLRLAQAMAELEERLPRPLHIICGMMANKDAEAFLGKFNGLAEFFATIAIPGHENCYRAMELAKLANDIGLNAAPQAGLIEALQTCRAVATVPSRVLICGSLYLAGYVLKTHVKT